MGFTSLRTFIFILFLLGSGILNGSNLSMAGLQGGVIAEIFQGKSGFSIQLIPEGQVSLTLYSMKGQEIPPSQVFESPSVQMPTFNVPQSGFYLLVARHGVKAESFKVYIQKD